MLERDSYGSKQTCLPNAFDDRFESVTGPAHSWGACSWWGSGTSHVCSWMKSLRSLRTAESARLSKTGPPSRDTLLNKGSPAFIQVHDTDRQTDRQTVRQSHWQGTNKSNAVPPLWETNSAPRIAVYNCFWYITHEHHQETSWYTAYCGLHLTWVATTVVHRMREATPVFVYEDSPFFTRLSSAALWRSTSPCLQCWFGRKQVCSPTLHISLGTEMHQLLRGDVHLNPFPVQSGGL